MPKEEDVPVCISYLDQAGWYTRTIHHTLHIHTHRLPYPRQQHFNRPAGSWLQNYAELSRNAAKVRKTHTEILRNFLSQNFV
jgi:hypothetical protein